MIQREDLKVIISSATLDEETFQKFFFGAPVLNLPGRPHQVEISYPDLEELDAIAGIAGIDLEDLRRNNQNNYEKQRRERHIVSLVAAINKKAKTSRGDVLVFLPGQEEIENIAEQIGKLPEQVGSAQFLVLPCFSSLPMDEQAQIFEEAPPGFRKIILATNIAESSITIDGTKYVIDCGAAKSKWYCFSCLTG